LKNTDETILRESGEEISMTDCVSEDALVADSVEFGINVVVMENR
jgi:hypothetical protein